MIEFEHIIYQINNDIKPTQENIKYLDELINTQILNLI